MQLKQKSELPFVSIVICTYNRKELLKECLDSIFAMEYPKNSYEVIIVDGGSTDGTEEICKVFPNIQFTTEHKQGLAYARNKGAELGCGSIIAYTDDDCIVDRNWLKNLVAGFKFSHKVIGVGGPVYPFRPEIIPKKIHVKAALGLYDNGENMKLTDGIVTSNAAFKKEIFKIVKFDEELRVTRRGKMLLCGEDTDLCQTILNSGYALLYTPYAKVYHQINGKRLRVPYIIKHAIHNGESQARFYFKRRKSRIWAVRYATGQLMQNLLKTPFNASFASCYNIVYSLSALVFSATRLL